MMDDQECFKYIIVATVQQGYFGVQATDDNRCFWFLSSAFGLAGNTIFTCNRKQIQLNFFFVTHTNILIFLPWRLKDT